MQYTKLDAAIPTKPKYSVLIVTVMDQSLGGCADLPEMMV
jgi:hypothetical protein